MMLLCSQSIYFSSAEGLPERPKVLFQTDYGKIELKKISYDVISVTSSLLRHQNVTKLTSQFFSILSSSQSKFRSSPVPLYHTYNHGF